jgi:hypothetical protein
VKVPTAELNEIVINTEPLTVSEPQEQNNFVEESKAEQVSNENNEQPVKNFHDQEQISLK